MYKNIKKQKKVSLFSLLFLGFLVAGCDEILSGEGPAEAIEVEGGQEGGEVSEEQQERAKEQKTQREQEESQEAAREEAARRGNQGSAGESSGSSMTNGTANEGSVNSTETTADTPTTKKSESAGSSDQAGDTTQLNEELAATKASDGNSSEPTPVIKTTIVEDAKTSGVFDAKLSLAERAKAWVRTVFDRIGEVFGRSPSAKKMVDQLNTAVDQMQNAKQGTQEYAQALLKTSQLQDQILNGYVTSIGDEYSALNDQLSNLSAGELRALKTALAESAKLTANVQDAVINKTQQDFMARIIEANQGPETLAGDVGSYKMSKGLFEGTVNDIKNPDSDEPLWLNVATLPVVLPVVGALALGEAATYGVMRALEGVGLKDQPIFRQVPEAKNIEVDSYAELGFDYSFRLKSVTERRALINDKFQAALKDLSEIPARNKAAREKAAFKVTEIENYGSELLGENSFVEGYHDSEISKMSITERLSSGDATFRDSFAKRFDTKSDWYSTKGKKFNVDGGTTKGGQTFEFVASSREVQSRLNDFNKVVDAVVKTINTTLVPHLDPAKINKVQQQMNVLNRNLTTAPTAPAFGGM